MLGGNCSPCCGTDPCEPGPQTLRITISGLPGSCSYINGQVPTPSINRFPFVNRSAKTLDNCTLTLFRRLSWNLQPQCQYDALVPERINYPPGGNGYEPVNLDPVAGLLTLPHMGSYSATFSPVPGKSFRSLPYDDFVVLNYNHYDNNCSAEELSSIRVRIEPGRADALPVYCPRYPYNFGLYDHTSCTTSDAAPLLPATFPPGSVLIQSYNVPILHCAPCDAGSYYTVHQVRALQQFNDDGSACVDPEGGGPCYSSKYILPGAPDDLNVSASFSGSFQNLSGSYALKFSDMGDGEGVQGWGGNFYANGAGGASGVTVALRLYVQPMGYLMTQGSGLSIGLLPNGTPVSSCGHDNISYSVRCSVFYTTSPFSSYGNYRAFIYWNHAFSFYSGTQCQPRVCRALPQFSVSGTGTVNASTAISGGQISYSVSSI